MLQIQMERAAENASSVSGDRDGGWTETLIYSLGLDTHFISYFNNDSNNQTSEDSDDRKI